MKQEATYRKWLNVAYQEFAEHGPDFSLKAISIKEALPRTTFYYHFTNKDDLIDELLQYHSSKIVVVRDEISKIKILIPDLYEALYNYKTSLMFYKQLLKNRHIVNYNDLYIKGNKDVIKGILPQIKAYFGFEYTYEEIFDFYNTLTDAWYATLDFNNFSVKSMTDLAESIMASILRITNE